MDPNKKMSSKDKSKISPDANTLSLQQHPDTSVLNIINEITNVKVKSNHILELLCRDPILNMETDNECNLAFSFNQFNKYNFSNTNTTDCGFNNHSNNHSNNQSNNQS